ncbi:MAG: hypothetical protein HQK53_14950 [Oligoflexia bacterium]|nr:hypothetical protein [Oligoflexia bacterium]
MKKKSGNYLTFFTPEEKEKISQTIKKVEQSTSGEIVVLVADSSNNYDESAILGLIGVSMFLGIIIEHLIAIYSKFYSQWDGDNISFGSYLGDFLLQSLNETSLWRFLIFTVISFIILYLIMMIYPTLKLRLVSKSKVEKRLKEQAILAFYQNELYKTCHKTGVLIFISILERQVFILGDSGINQKIAEGFWYGLAEELTSGIRVGRAGESICRVIEKCGQELKKYFPLLDDDKNELSNEVIIK